MDPVQHILSVTHQHPNGSGEPKQEFTSMIYNLWRKTKRSTDVHKLIPEGTHYTQYPP